MRSLLQFTAVSGDSKTSSANAPYVKSLYFLRSYKSLCDLRSKIAKKNIKKGTENPLSKRQGYNNGTFCRWKYYCTVQPKTDKC